MRVLVYVPIIHDEVDFGSLGSIMGRASVGLAGQDRWTLHQETMERFWQNVSHYLGHFDPLKIRVYQDGMAVDGALGRRVVEEGARRGSKNYQLVLSLLDRGAELRAAEDRGLLLQERARLANSVSHHSKPAETESLLTQRDRYIAQRINSTLLDGETGVLFIGAVHNVFPRLDSDIVVHKVKDPQKLHLYMQVVMLGAEAEKLAALAGYVAGPIKDPW